MEKVLLYFFPAPVVAAEERVEMWVGIMPGHLNHWPGVGKGMEKLTQESGSELGSGEKIAFHFEHFWD